MNVLVTGFEPFGGEKINPSWEAVRRLPGCIAGAQISKAQLPVAFGLDRDCLQNVIEAESPDIVICVGQAGGRVGITPELVGVNYLDASRPDNRGAQPRAARITPHGPDAHFTTLPVHAMVHACDEAGIPARVSYSAGTYCCNEVLYGLLEYLEHANSGIKGGFVHVPYLPGQAEKRGEGVPSMPLQTIVKGLELMVEAAVSHMDEGPFGSNPSTSGAIC